VPENIRHAVKSRLPLSLQDKLTAFWRMGGIDYSDTKAFALVADLQGYIRINLKGREAQGIVEPGEEMDALCATIEDGLLSFRDADTGEPIVREIIRTDALYPQGGAKMDMLPDLLVKWSFTPCAKHRAIVSDACGEIAWPTPGRNFTGRAGNHRPEGFIAAAGPGIRSGAAMNGANILDLAPTVHALLRRDVPPSMQGKPLVCVV
jgi:predicted AlkP superfamily phosphohydrolase/phosphomutase